GQAQVSYALALGVLAAVALVVGLITGLNGFDAVLLSTVAGIAGLANVVDKGVQFLLQKKTPGALVTTIKLIASALWRSLSSLKAKFVFTSVSVTGFRWVKLLEVFLLLLFVIFETLIIKDANSIFTVSGGPVDSISSLRGGLFAESPYHFAFVQIDIALVCLAAMEMVTIIFSASHRGFSEEIIRHLLRDNKAGILKILFVILGAFTVLVLSWPVQELIHQTTHVFSAILLGSPINFSRVYLAPEIGGGIFHGILPGFYEVLRPEQFGMFGARAFEAAMAKYSVSTLSALIITRITPNVLFAVIALYLIRASVLKRSLFCLILGFGLTSWPAVFSVVGDYTLASQFNMPTGLAPGWMIKMSIFNFSIDRFIMLALTWFIAVAIFIVIKRPSHTNIPQSSRAIAALIVATLVAGAGIAVGLLIGFIWAIPSFVLASWNLIKDIIQAFLRAPRDSRAPPLTTPIAQNNNGTITLHPAAANLLIYNPLWHEQAHTTLTRLHIPGFIQEFTINIVDFIGLFVKATGSKDLSRILGRENVHVAYKQDPVGFSEALEVISSMVMEEFEALINRLSSLLGRENVGAAFKQDSFGFAEVLRAISSMVMEEFEALINKLFRLLERENVESVFQYDSSKFIKVLRAIFRMGIEEFEALINRLSSLLGRENVGTAFKHDSSEFIQVLRAISSMGMEEFEALIKGIKDEYSFFFCADLSPQGLEKAKDILREARTEDLLVSPDREKNLRVYLLAILFIYRSLFPQLITEGLFSAIGSRILLQARIDDSYDEANGNFRIGTYCTKNFSIRFVIGILAHEVGHNIECSRLPASSPCDEFTADLGALAVLEDMGWDGAIAERQEYFKYEECARAKAANPVVSGTYQTARAQIHRIVEGLRKHNLPVVWTLLFRLTVEEWRRNKQTEFDSFAKNILRAYLREYKYVAQPSAPTLNKKQGHAHLLSTVAGIAGLVNIVANAGMVVVTSAILTPIISGLAATIIIGRAVLRSLKQQRPEVIQKSYNISAAGQKRAGLFALIGAAAVALATVAVPTIGAISLLSYTIIIAPVLVFIGAMFFATAYYIQARGVKAGRSPPAHILKEIQKSIEKKYGINILPHDGREEVAYTLDGENGIHIDVERFNKLPGLIQNSVIAHEKAHIAGHKEARACLAQAVNLLGVYGIVLLALLALTSIGVHLPQAQTILADPTWGRVINWFIGFVNIASVTCLVVEKKGGYKALGVHKLVANELKDRILALVSKEEKNQVSGIIQGYSLSEMRRLYSYLLRLCKAQESSHTAQESDSLSAKMRSSGIGLAEELGESWQITEGFVRNFIKGKGAWSIPLTIAALIAAVPFFLLRVTVLFFANYSLKNVEFLNRLEAGEVKLDNALLHIQAFDKGQKGKKSLALGERWFAFTLRFPVPCGIIKFALNRLSLVVFSTFIAHPLALALFGSGTIGFLSGLYDLISQVSPDVGGFLVKHFAPTWSSLLSVIILNYLLSGRSSLNQIWHNWLDTVKAREFGLPTLELEQLFVSRDRITTQKDKDAIDKIIRRANQAGYLYTRRNKQLFSLVTSGPSRIKYTLRYFTFLLWGIPLYLINPVLPLGLLAKLFTGNNKGLDSVFGSTEALSKLRMAFWSGTIGLASIGIEIGLVQVIGEWLGGPAEALIGPWEGSSTASGPFHYPILGIGGDVMGGLSKELNIDAANFIYQAAGGKGTMQEASIREQKKVEQESLAEIAGFIKSHSQDPIDLITAKAETEKFINIEGAYSQEELALWKEILPILKENGFGYIAIGLGQEEQVFVDNYMARSPQELAQYDRYDMAYKRAVAGLSEKDRAFLDIVKGSGAGFKVVAAVKQEEDGWGVDVDKLKAMLDKGQKVASYFSGSLGRESSAAVRSFDYETFKYTQNEEEANALAGLGGYTIVLRVSAGTEKAFAVDVDNNELGGMPAEEITLFSGMDSFMWSSQNAPTMVWSLAKAYDALAYLPSEQAVSKDKAADWTGVSEILPVWALEGTSQAQGNKDNPIIYTLSLAEIGARIKANEEVAPQLLDGLRNLAKADEAEGQADEYSKRISIMKYILSFDYAQQVDEKVADMFPDFVRLINSKEQQFRSEATQLLEVFIEEAAANQERQARLNTEPLRSQVAEAFWQVISGRDNQDSALAAEDIYLKALGLQKAASGVNSPLISDKETDIISGKISSYARKEAYYERIAQRGEEKAVERAVGEYKEDQAYIERMLAFAQKLGKAGFLTTAQTGKLSAVLTGYMQKDYYELGVTYAKTLNNLNIGLLENSRANTLDNDSILQAKERVAFGVGYLFSRYPQEEAMPDANVRDAITQAYDYLDEAENSFSLISRLGIGNKGLAEVVGLKGLIDEKIAGNIGNSSSLSARIDWLLLKGEIVLPKEGIADYSDLFSSLGLAGMDISGLEGSGRKAEPAAVSEFFDELSKVRGEAISAQESSTAKDEERIKALEDAQVKAISRKDNSDYLISESKYKSALDTILAEHTPAGMNLLNAMLASRYSADIAHYVAGRIESILKTEDIAPEDIEASLTVIEAIAQKSESQAEIDEMASWVSRFERSGNQEIAEKASQSLASLDKRSDEITEKLPAPTATAVPLTAPTPSEVSPQYKAREDVQPKGTPEPKVAQGEAGRSKAVAYGASDAEPISFKNGDKIAYVLSDEPVIKPTPTPTTEPIKDYGWVETTKKYIGYDNYNSIVTALKAEGFSVSQTLMRDPNGYAVAIYALHKQGTDKMVELIDLLDRKLVLSMFEENPAGLAEVLSWDIDKGKALLEPLYKEFGKENVLNILFQHNRFRALGYFEIGNLAEIITNRINNRPDGRPLATLIYPARDKNGAFSENESKNIVASLIEKGYRVMAYEAATDNEMIYALKDSAKEEKASVVILFGHGTQTTINFGASDSIDRSAQENEGYFLGVNDESRLVDEKITGCLVDEGVIILISCSTAKGGCEENNVANMLHRIFPQAKSIIAPLVDTEVDALVYGKDNKVIGIKYHDEAFDAAACLIPESSSPILSIVMSGGFNKAVARPLKYPSRGLGEEMKVPDQAVVDILIEMFGEEKILGMREKDPYGFNMVVGAFNKDKADALIALFGIERVSDIFINIPFDFTKIMGDFNQDTAEAFISLFGRDAVTSAFVNDPYGFALATKAFDKNKVNILVDLFGLDNISVIFAEDTYSFARMLENIDIENAGLLTALLERGKAYIAFRNDLSGFVEATNAFDQDSAIALIDLFGKEEVSAAFVTDPSGFAKAMGMAGRVNYAVALFGKDEASMAFVTDPSGFARTMEAWDRIDNVIELFGKDEASMAFVTDPSGFAMTMRNFDRDLINALIELFGKDKASMAFVTDPSGFAMAINGLDFDSHNAELLLKLLDIEKATDLFTKDPYGFTLATKVFDEGKVKELSKLFGIDKVSDLLAKDPYAYMLTIKNFDKNNAAAIIALFGMDNAFSAFLKEPYGFAMATKKFSEKRSDALAELLGLGQDKISDLFSADPFGFSMGLEAVVKMWSLDADGKTYNDVIAGLGKERVMGILTERNRLMRFGRFSPEIFTELMTNRIHDSPDGRKLAVVIFSTADHNGALFTEENNTLFDSLIKKGYRLMYYEAATDDEMVDVLRDATKDEQASLLLIGAHGSSSRLKFGSEPLVNEGIPSEGYFLDLEDEHELRRIQISDSLKDGGSILLMSCGTGAGHCDEANLANMLYRVFPEAAHLIAPSIETSVPRLLYDNDGKVIAIDLGKWVHDATKCVISNPLAFGPMSAATPAPTAAPRSSSEDLGAGAGALLEPVLSSILKESDKRLKNAEKGAISERGPPEKTFLEALDILWKEIKSSPATFSLLYHLEEAKQWLPYFSSRTEILHTILSIPIFIQSLFFNPAFMPSNSFAMESRTVSSAVTATSTPEVSPTAEFDYRDYKGHKIEGSDEFRKAVYAGFEQLETIRPELVGYIGDVKPSTGLSVLIEDIVYLIMAAHDDSTKEVFINETYLLALRESLITTAGILGHEAAHLFIGRLKQQGHFLEEVLPVDEDFMAYLIGLNIYQRSGVDTGLLVADIVDVLSSEYLLRMRWDKFISGRFEVPEEKTEVIGKIVEELENWEVIKAMQQGIVYYFPAFVKDGPAEEKILEGYLDAQPAARDALKQALSAKEAALQGWDIEFQVISGKVVAETNITDIASKKAVIKVNEKLFNQPILFALVMNHETNHIVSPEATEAAIQAKDAEYIEKHMAGRTAELTKGLKAIGAEFDEGILKSIIDLNKDTLDYTVYTVQKGDTLSGVFGDNWQVVYKLNKEIIGEDPDLIEVGQQFLVPKDYKSVKEAGAEPVKIEAVKETPVPGVTAGEHIVQAGESLWSIAEKELGRGSRWVEIADLNNIDKENPVIYAEQKLVMPGAGASPLKTEPAATSAPKPADELVSPEQAKENEPLASGVKETEPLPVLQPKALPPADVAWLIKQIDPATRLVSSFEGGHFANTYDQALAVIRFMQAYKDTGDPVYLSYAKDILDFYAYRAEKSDGVLPLMSYTIGTGAPNEYGVRTGEAAWLGIAIAYFQEATSDLSYYQMMINIADALISDKMQLADGGIVVEGGRSDELQITEHNLSSISFLGWVYLQTGKEKYQKAQEKAIKWLEKMYDANNHRFYLGESKDEIDDRLVTDTAWAVQALSFQKEKIFDFAKVMQYLEDNVNVSDSGLSGYAFTSGRDAISFEWTLLAAVSWKMLGRNDLADKYISAIDKKFSSGVVPYVSKGTKTVEGWDVAAENSVASTVWFNFAKKGFSPLVVPDKSSLDRSLLPDAENIGGVSFLKNKDVIVVADGNSAVDSKCLKEYLEKNPDLEVGSTVRIRCATGVFVWGYIPAERQMNAPNDNIPLALAAEETRKYAERVLKEAGLSIDDLVVDKNNPPSQEKQEVVGKIAKRINDFKFFVEKAIRDGGRMDIDYKTSEITFTYQGMLTFDSVGKKWSEPIDIKTVVPFTEEKGIISLTYNKALYAFDPESKGSWKSDNLYARPGERLEKIVLLNLAGRFTSEVEKFAKTGEQWDEKRIEEFANKFWWGGIFYSKYREYRSDKGYDVYMAVNQAFQDVHYSTIVGSESKIGAATTGEAASYFIEKRYVPYIINYFNNPPQGKAAQPVEFLTKGLAEEVLGALTRKDAGGIWSWQQGAATSGNWSSTAFPKVNGEIIRVDTPKEYWEQSGYDYVWQSFTQGWAWRPFAQSFDIVDGKVQFPIMDKDNPTHGRIYLIDVADLKDAWVKGSLDKVKKEYTGIEIEVYSVQEDGQVAKFIYLHTSTEGYVEIISSLEVDSANVLKGKTIASSAFGLNDKYVYLPYHERLYRFDSPAKLIEAIKKGEVRSLGFDTRINLLTASRQLSQYEKLSVVVRYDGDDPTLIEGQANIISTKPGDLEPGSRFKPRVIVSNPITLYRDETGKYKIRLVDNKYNLREFNGKDARKFMDVVKAALGANRDLTAIGKDTKINIKSVSRELPGQAARVAVIARWDDESPDLVEGLINIVSTKPGDLEPGSVLGGKILSSTPINLYEGKIRFLDLRHNLRDFDGSKAEDFLKVVEDAFKADDKDIAFKDKYELVAVGSDTGVNIRSEARDLPGLRRLAVIVRWDDSSPELIEGLVNVVSTKPGDLQPGLIRTASGEMRSATVLGGRTISSSTIALDKDSGVITFIDTADNLREFKGKEAEKFLDVVRAEFIALRDLSGAGIDTGINIKATAFDLPGRAERLAVIERWDDANPNVIVEGQVNLVSTKPGDIEPGSMLKGKVLSANNFSGKDAVVQFAYGLGNEKRVYEFSSVLQLIRSVYNNTVPTTGFDTGITYTKYMVKYNGEDAVLLHLKKGQYHKIEVSTGRIDRAKSLFKSILDLEVVFDETKTTGGKVIIDVSVPDDSANRSGKVFRYEDTAGAKAVDLLMADILADKVGKVDASGKVLGSGVDTGITYTRDMVKYKGKEAVLLHLKKGIYHKIEVLGSTIDVEANPFKVTPEIEVAFDEATTVAGKFIVDVAVADDSKNTKGKIFRYIGITIDEAIKALKDDIAADMVGKTDKAAKGVDTGITYTRETINTKDGQSLIFLHMIKDKYHKIEVLGNTIDETKSPFKVLAELEVAFEDGKPIDVSVPTKTNADGSSEGIIRRYNNYTDLEKAITAGSVATEGADLGATYTRTPITYNGKDAILLYMTKGPYHKVEVLGKTLDTNNIFKVVPELEVAFEDGKPIDVSVPTKTNADGSSEGIIRRYNNYTDLEKA
ncbi:MAG: LysM peptidoglycan-binding domain-containing protein, partial [Candidatus Omnitrophota bacterium]